MKARARIGPLLAAAWLSLAFALAGADTPPAAPPDPVAQDYENLIKLDDLVQEEIEAWEEAAQTNKFLTDVSRAALDHKIKQRLEMVRLAYEKFVSAHPEHVNARLTFGSFLREIGRDAEALKHWEEARRLAPANPAVWNNLGTFYGENGPVTNAFVCYAKAIELAPKQPLYYHNLAQNIYLNQEEAGIFYGLKQREVVRKAQELYRKTLELSPTNFIAAADLAQSFYAIRLPITGEAEADRKAAQALTDEALAAWELARKLARDDVERQGVCLHLARVQISAGRFAAARQNLAEAKDPSLAGIKAELEARLEKEEQKARP